MLSPKVQFWAVQSWVEGTGFRGAGSQGSQGYGTQGCNHACMFWGCRAQRFRAWGCRAHGYTVPDVGVQGLGALGMRVQGLCVQVTGMQNIWVQDLGCQQGPFHPDTIQGPPEALMEKDVDGCQDGAKTEPSARLGTEGTETQVRPGGHRWGEAGVWWDPRGVTAEITHSWTIL